MLVLAVHSIRNIWILDARTLSGHVGNGVRAYAEVNGARFEIRIKLPAFVRPRPGHPEYDFGTFTIEEPAFDPAVLVGTILRGKSWSPESANR